MTSNDILCKNGFVCTFNIVIFSFQVYVEYIVKNPVLSLQDLITSELFKQKLDIFVKQSPAFSSNKLSQY